MFYYYNLYTYVKGFKSQYHAYLQKLEALSLRSQMRQGWPYFPGAWDYLSLYLFFQHIWSFNLLLLLYLTLFSWDIIKSGKKVNDHYLQKIWLYTWKTWENVLKLLQIEEFINVAQEKTTTTTVNVVWGKQRETNILYV